MASVFSRIIAGELPGTFVWKDERCVAFLSIAPMMPGHTLVVPREEIDHWIDLDPELNAHLFEVARIIGRAQREAFDPRRVGVLIVGDEVPHVHLHLVPIDVATDLQFDHADPKPPAGSLDEAAARLRAALRAQGADSVAD